MRRAVLPCSSGMAPALLAMLALAGCADRFPPPPIINSISPTSGQVDQSQSMEIFGSGFAVRVFTDFSDPNQSRTDDTYVVKIGGVALTGVQHLSTDELTGTLPAGVTPGNNDLEVTDPWGRTVTVPAAYFGVPTGGLPTALAVLGPANVPIGTCQQVTVEQRNAAGAATVSLTPTPVALDTTPASAFGIFSDGSCGTAVTSTTIDVGQTQVLVYVRATDRVSASLVASSTGLTNGTHAFVFGPTRLAFTNAAITANVGVCVNAPLTLETRDPAGVASAVATDTVVNLAAPSNLALFTSNTCSTPATTVTVPAMGTTSTSFFIKGLAAGTFTITASSSGYTNATQPEVMQANTIFVFSSIGPQQGVATPFPVTIEAQDGLGNLVTTFTGTPALTGLGGTTVTCAYNCNNNGVNTTGFTLGGWSGWVSANTSVASAQIHAASGSTTGDSNFFQVLSPDAGFSAPTARLMVHPGAVNATGDTVTLDARLSSDYGQGNLEYSFDKDGTAASAPGTTPWTNWGNSGTFNATGYTTGVWQPRVAVRKQGDTVVSYASATVAATTTTFCLVTTTSMIDDGAMSCSNGTKFGTDNAISLPEAIALTNGGSSRAITTNTPLRFVFDPLHPLPAVDSANWISFASGTQLVNNPLPLNGAGALLANADISGPANWDVMSNATIQDTVLRDGASLSTGVALTLSRVLAFHCPASNACVRSVASTGSLRVLFSQFIDVPAEALRISSGSCGANAVEVLGSTFTRTATGIRDDCTSASSSLIRHATFHGGGTGILYAGGSGHVLQNSVFSSNANATNCGAATFTTRDNNLLFGNASDGCASTSDPNTLSADPLYFLPEVGDLRDRSNSPARDSAAAGGLDVNDTAPGLFFGAGPDRGGRETP